MAKFRGTSSQVTKTTPAGGVRTRQSAKPSELPSAEALALSFVRKNPEYEGYVGQEDLMRFAELVHQKLEQVPQDAIQNLVQVSFKSDELRGLEKIVPDDLLKICGPIARQYPRFKNVLIAYRFEEPKQEERVSEPLAAYLTEMNVPREKWQEAALELARVVLRLSAPDDRPLWDDRAKYPELAKLSAPQFLKQVWADQIGPDGMIEKESVRQKDPKLMSNVEKYVAKREEREQDAGDADGLKFIRSRVGRPKGLQTR